MASFFRTMVLDAARVDDRSTAIRSLRAEAFDGILVKCVYSAEDCAAVCARLESGDHGLIRSEFPSPFRSHFLGLNLNLAPPDLAAYFPAAQAFHADLPRLFGPVEDPRARASSLLSRLDGGRAYRAAPGPQAGDEHMFLTLRAHLQGGYIPQHFDNEQTLRPSYRHIAPRISGDLFSYVLAFSIAEAGGALEVFNMRRGDRQFRMADSRDSASRLDVAGVESVQFRLEPGDMMIFNSGRLLHRVTPVLGPATRWTACSFMSEGRDGDVLCWG